MLVSTPSQLVNPLGNRRRHGFGTGAGGGAAFAGVLDDYSANLAAALSVARRLLTSYTGPLVRIRRSSDNTEDDFDSVAGTGMLDTAAVTSFIGGGSGYVVTVYDQSGNARHVTNATAAQQPEWVVLGNGIAAARFTDGSGRRLQAATFTLSQPYSRLHTAVAGTQVANRYLFDGGSADSSLGYTGAVTAGACKQYIFAGSFFPAFDTSTVTTTDDAVFCGRYEFNGASSLLKTGSTSVTGNAGAAAAGGITIGNRFNGTGGAPLAQDWHEHFAWTDIDQARNETLRVAGEAAFE